MDTELKTLLLDIKQMPEPDRQQAVIVATVKNSQGEKQGIGAVANNPPAKAYDPQALLDKAAEEAISRAYSNANAPAPPQKSPSAEKPASHTTIDGSKNNYKGKHRTEPGTISDKQFTTLDTMARERNQSFEDISKQMFHASPADLSSQQAQDLFDHFRNKKAVA